MRGFVGGDFAAGLPESFDKTSEHDEIGEEQVGSWPAPMSETGHHQWLNGRVSAPGLGGGGSNPGQITPKSIQGLDLEGMDHQCGRGWVKWELRYVMASAVFIHTD